MRAVYFSLTLIVFYILFCLVRHLQNKRDEKSYRERHTVKIENVNKEKLKELLTDCEKNGIDHRKRLCDCRCPYSEAKPDSDFCYDEKGNDTDDPEKCFAVFGCGSHCSVFNTDVEHISCCCWNEQDESESDSCKCLCLLSKCEENEELKTLVDELQSKDLK